MTIPKSDEADCRDGRVMRLILDELHALRVLPLHLQMPSDIRLMTICNQLLQQLDDTATMEVGRSDWGSTLRRYSVYS